ncbi:MAG: hypothetical protein ACRDNB_03915 [Gaiellaceae bacterium]
MRHLALLTVLAVAGCSGSGGVDARLRVVVPDKNIREEGIECSGARPFRAIHRGTAFTIEDGDGEVVADGELPSGVAVNADPGIDWETDLIPTVCTFDVEVGLPERARYRLVLPETLPLDFERSQLGDEPLRLILAG